MKEEGGKGNKQQEKFRERNAETERRRTATLTRIQSQGLQNDERVVVTTYNNLVHEGTLKLSVGKNKRIVGIVLYFDRGGLLPIGLQNIKNIERAK